MSTMTTDRDRILATAVHAHAAKGWRVESVIGTTAIMVKTRRFSRTSHGFLTVVTLGLWAPILAIAAIRARRRHLAITVDDYGNTLVSKR